MEKPYDPGSHSRLPVRAALRQHGDLLGRNQTVTSSIGRRPLSRSTPETGATLLQRHPDRCCAAA